MLSCNLCIVYIYICMLYNIDYVHIYTHVVCMYTPIQICRDRYPDHFFQVDL